MTLALRMLKRRLPGLPPSLNVAACLSMAGYVASRSPSASRLAQAVAVLRAASASAFDLSSRAGREVSVRELEDFFFDLVSRLSPDLFIEAGAKAADASLRARRLLPGPSQVVAFEANPFTHERFSKKTDYAASGVAYRNVALSTKPGTVSFNVRKTDDGRPSADGQGSLLKNETYDPGHIQVQVEATILDDVVEEFSARQCVLWVDVEGAVREVLGGAQATLRASSVVFIEVEDREYWASQWLRARVLEELSRAGLVPIARDYQSRFQWNVVCVQKNLLASRDLAAALHAHHVRLHALKRARSRLQA